MTLSDLSPDALARLEAKLLADVEVVRRMRVLMQEHHGMLGGIGTTPAAALGPLPAAAVPVAPVPVRKPMEEAALDCLMEMPADVFVVDDVRRALRKAGYSPRDNSMKTLVNRWIRQGKVCVHQLKHGRGGSIYRRTIPQAEPTVSLDSTPLSPDSSPLPAVP